MSQNRSTAVMQRRVERDGDYPEQGASDGEEA